MPYVNDTENSTSYTNDTETGYTYNATTVGSPIGLLLALTYAEVIESGTYIWDEGNATTYSLDNKPS